MVDAKTIVNFSLRLAGRKIKDQPKAKYDKAIRLMESTLAVIKIYERHQRQKRRKA